jgi:DNA topoisomerase-1
MSLLASASPQAAKDAGLRYVSCSEPGIERIKRGKGFVYRLPSGKLVRQAAELERIRKLALPPAWRSVWICRDPRGHLLATGLDAKGRKQYRYHPRWRCVRDEAKYDDLLELGRRLPRLRRRLARDLMLPRLVRDKVLATLVTVMAGTGVRVGSDRYASENGSFGLTTLLDRHAQITPSQIQFSFKGKGGKPYRVSVRDRRLSAIVKRCRDIPGQRLFQYEDETGSFQAVTSSDVNEYLKRVSAMELTAKTLRTWSATLLASTELAALPPAKSAAELKRHISDVLSRVARHLGNTPAVCRKSYVDPRVLEAYASTKLQRCAKRATRTSGLTRPECELLAILESSRQLERRAA